MEHERPILCTFWNSSVCEKSGDDSGDDSPDHALCSAALRALAGIKAAASDADTGSVVFALCRCRAAVFRFALFYRPVSVYRVPLQWPPPEIGVPHVASVPLRRTELLFQAAMRYGGQTMPQTG
ncbi:hypothetical protein NDU88_003195 [Pleurodeles waltl]|uniref:Uncharacterized protein n=1 Tax=Pleurodeles waltl TaxID=8319 RepID=A0AAV7WNC7_PLEWA|nr:hypothetical protein NDU88_003195 [Pleurodeles waltl]